jgi:hypothetical protein
VYLMLKALNQGVLRARRQKAAWERWARKMPHNRVRRPVLRDADGQFAGFGPTEPLPEPIVHSLFCKKVTLPSGKVSVELVEQDVEAAYRQARQPLPTAQEVLPLLIPEEKVARLYRQICGEQPA